MKKLITILLFALVAISSYSQDFRSLEFCSFNHGEIEFDMDRYPGNNYDVPFTLHSLTDITDYLRRLGKTPLKISKTSVYPHDNTGSYAYFHWGYKINFDKTTEKFSFTDYSSFYTKLVFNEETKDVEVVLLVSKGDGNSWKNSLREKGYQIEKEELTSNGLFITLHKKAGERFNFMITVNYDAYIYSVCIFKKNPLAFCLESLATE